MPDIALALPADVALRPERPDDAAFLRRVFDEARGGILAGLDPGLAETLLRHQFAGQSMTYRTQFPKASFDIVEATGAPVGRIVVDRSGGGSRIVDIALRAAWRGRGIGTQLLRAILDEADMGGRPVDLCVAPDNHAARRLYERLGFITISVAPTEIAMRRIGET